MGHAVMATIKQTVTIEWHDVALMPQDEGTYLVAFDDGSVETYPIGSDNIQSGIIQDGYTRGVLWAHPIYAPIAN